MVINLMEKNKSREGDGKVRMEVVMDRGAFAEKVAFR
jgi:hypothetical protein